MAVLSFICCFVHASAAIVVWSPGLEKCCLSEQLGISGFLTAFHIILEKWFYCIQCQWLLLLSSASCLTIAQDPGASCLCGWPTSGSSTGTSCRGHSPASHGCGGSSRMTLTYSVPWSRYGTLWQKICRKEGQAS